MLHTSITRLCTLWKTQSIYITFIASPSRKNGELRLPWRPLTLTTMDQVHQQRHQQQKHTKEMLSTTNASNETKATAAPTQQWYKRPRIVVVVVRNSLLRRPWRGYHDVFIAIVSTALPLYRCCFAGWAQWKLAGMLGLDLETPESCVCHDVFSWAHIST